MANEGLIQQKQNEKKLLTPQERKMSTMRDMIKRMEGEIKKALPSIITPERFTRIALSALSSTPKLVDCTPQSFIGALMVAAQLGLEPNTPLGQAFLVPYDNKKKGLTECQFNIGYMGVIDLAYRSGEVSTIYAQTVYENDKFEYELGLDPKLKHVPARDNRGEPTHFYGVFRTKDGGYGFEVMSIEDARKHGERYSSAFNNGPWQTNFEEMAKKTVLKKALKYAPKKSEFAKALVQDETVKTEILPDMLDSPSQYVEIEDYKVSMETGEIK